MCTVIIDVYCCRYCHREVEPRTRREPSWVPCDGPENYSHLCPNYRPEAKKHYQHVCRDGTGCQTEFAKMHYGDVLEDSHAGIAIDEQML
ncbi:uncharacterized protein PG986_002486 [Apiospora aurea]|uniref:Uncharacterized protein n=1 Tax=Apiospora aurea TaxID=335848 RepID=A0ABR1QQK4_9PEZI